ncbi:MAG: hypothetical protein WCF92_01805 [bacterium]
MSWTLKQEKIKQYKNIFDITFPYAAYWRLFVASNGTELKKHIKKIKRKVKA